MTDEEVTQIFRRLREELRARPEAFQGDDESHIEPPRLAWRVTAERFASVTGDLPYMHRPGAIGRLRGLVLMPVKYVTRKLVRWYVEPIAVQQREFNAAVLRALDELTEWTADQVSRIERRSGS